MHRSRAAPGEPSADLKAQLAGGLVRIFTSLRSM